MVEFTDVGLEEVEASMRSVRPDLTSVVDLQSYRPHYLPFPARVTLREAGSIRSEVLKTAKLKESLQFEIDVLEMVRKAGLPVPQILSPIFELDHSGERLWAVSLEEIEGTPLDWLALRDLNAADLTGKLFIEGVQRLHQLTNTLIRLDTAKLVPRRELMDEYRLIKGSSSPWLGDPIISRALDLLGTKLPELSVSLVFSNGDYNPLNFMMKEGKVVGWIDFEHTCFEDPCIGLVKFLLWADDDYGWAAGAKSGLVEKFLFQENVRPCDFYYRILLRAAYYIHLRSIDDRPSYMLGIVEEYSKKLEQAAGCT